MLFDGLDGRVARWTNTQSDFGKEYDSLCDMVAFGLAPAILVYQWGVERIADYGRFWGRFGWLAAFFYAVAAGLRLARFNSRAAVADKRYFEGLPSPSAAATVAGFIWLVSEVEVDRSAATGAGVHGVDRGRRADGEQVCLLERQGAECARAYPVDLCAGHPAHLRAGVARAAAFARAAAVAGVFGTYALSGPLLWLWRKRTTRSVSGGALQRLASSSGQRSLLMDSRRLSYLRALDIDVWERRERVNDSGRGRTTVPKRHVPRLHRG